MNVCGIPTKNGYLFPRAHAALRSLALALALSLISVEDGCEIRNTYIDIEKFMSGQDSIRYPVTH